MRLNFVGKDFFEKKLKKNRKICAIRKLKKYKTLF